MVTFTEFHIIQINHVIPSILLLPIPAHLFPCHFCPRSILVVLTLVDKAIMVQISYRLLTTACKLLKFFISLQKF